MEKVVEKKVLLVTQNFYPENFKSNDIAFDLAKKGYIVEVLTGIPNYPEGVYYKGYGIFKRRTEIINGVKIYRCLQIPRGKKYTKILLPLTYLSFMFFASLWAIYLGFFKKYNLVIVHQVSPITQTLPAIIVKRIQKIPMILWVLDLWPEAFISGSGLNNDFLKSVLGSYVNFSYKNSDKILVSSKGFIEPVSERVGSATKIQYFPNWAEEIVNQESKIEIPPLPNGFKIMLAGNLGVSQNLENVMKAALALKNTDIRWIILGDGSKKNWIKDFIDENNLAENVFLMGKFPYETMPAFYEKANIMLLSLSNQYNDLKMVVPARLQSYMASGKPVLGFADGEANKMIKDANCGYTVEAHDVKGLVDLIENEILTNTERLSFLGMNGKKYFDKYFQKDRCINNLIKIIQELR